MYLIRLVKAGKLLYILLPYASYVLRCPQTLGSPAQNASFDSLTPAARRINFLFDVLAVFAKPCAFGVPGMSST